MGSTTEASDSRRLLESYDSSEEALPKHDPPRSRSAWSSKELCFAVIVIILAMSNAILLCTEDPSNRKGEGIIIGQDPSYFGSPQTVLTPFSHDWVGVLDQEHAGYRYRDEEWKTIFPRGGGSIALSTDFIEKHGLPGNAAATEEDPDKKIYLIAGYHQLHCLSVVRDAIYYLNGTMTEWPDENGFIWDHILHCIEAVRLGLTCFLDPTLINLNETWPGIPNGQMHQCRNREALHGFASANEHEIPKDPHSLMR